MPIEYWRDVKGCIVVADGLRGRIAKLFYSHAMMSEIALWLRDVGATTISVYPDDGTTEWLRDDCLERLAKEATDANAAPSEAA